MKGLIMLMTFALISCMSFAQNPENSLIQISDGGSFSSYDDLIVVNPNEIKSSTPEFRPALNFANQNIELARLSNDGVFTINGNFQGENDEEFIDFMYKYAMNLVGVKEIRINIKPREKIRITSGGTLAWPGGTIGYPIKNGISN